MGMYLTPVDADACESLGYNWSGWNTLANLLDQWGVDTSEFKGTNDGDVIIAETCLKVADALDAHFNELSGEFQFWLKGHADAWRELAASGGCEQH